MYHGKTLVVLFCMHRSGSSFAGRLLQRLGMSLGPFDLLGADDSNVHGHFEAAPIVALNCELQLEAFGFDGDFPRDPALLQRFHDGGGQWPREVAFSEERLEQGRGLIERLVASGRVSGFKDPRTVLTWPFWESVLDRFPGLRLVALSVLRSPHEIAMSMFRRSQGDCSYRDALDITAVHYRRMTDVLHRWRGDRAVLHFQPQTLAQQASRAAAACGLPWDDSALGEAYDPQSRHNVPAKVDHERKSFTNSCAEGDCPDFRISENGTVPFARKPGDTNGTVPLQRLESDNSRMLYADLALREQVLQRRCARMPNVRGRESALAETDRVVQRREPRADRQAPRAGGRRSDLGRVSPHARLGRLDGRMANQTRLAGRQKPPAGCGQRALSPDRQPPAAPPRDRVSRGR